MYEEAKLVQTVIYSWLLGALILLAYMYKMISVYM